MSYYLAAMAYLAGGTLVGVITGRFVELLRRANRR